MKIQLKLIDRNNYNDCIKLKVKQEQKRFVAPNIFSLVQAAYEPDIYTFGIYYNDVMVGFILYDLDDELKGWSMSRFMIDADYQNKGIGKAALKEFLNFFAHRYEHQPLYTSAEVDNCVAISLYESFGFKQQEVFEYGFDGEKYKEIRMLKCF